MVIRAFILDFDGTIIDTENADLQAWVEIFQNYGKDFPKDRWLTTIGHYSPQSDNLNFLLDHLPGVGLSELCEIHHKRWLELSMQLPLLPGVSRLIKFAQEKGILLAIASSSPRSWVEPLLKKLQLWDQFNCIVTFDDVKRSKPYPDVFLKALQIMGIAPEQAIIFEDLYNGIQASKNAGIYCILVPSSLTPEDISQGANLIINSLEEVDLQSLLDSFQLFNINNKECLSSD